MRSCSRSFRPTCASRSRPHPLLHPFAPARCVCVCSRSGFLAALSFCDSALTACSRPATSFQPCRTHARPRPCPRLRLSTAIRVYTALSRAALWLIAPMPHLATCTRLQRLGSRGRGSLSRAGELDAGGVFGRAGTTFTRTPMPSHLARVCASRLMTP